MFRILAHILWTIQLHSDLVCNPTRCAGLFVIHALLLLISCCVYEHITCLKVRIVCWSLWNKETYETHPLMKGYLLAWSRSRQRLIVKALRAPKVRTKLTWINRDDYLPKLPEVGFHYFEIWKQSTSSLLRDIFLERTFIVSIHYRIPYSFAVPGAEVFH